MKEKRNNVRLPEHISPIKYNLTLKPDLEAFVFEGSESILIDLKKPVKEIILHSKDLDILSVQIVQKKKSEFAKNILYNTKNETATLKFLSSLKKGKAELRLSFKGVLNDSLRGFYRSRFEHKGKVKHLATTQFEATDARRAFPCFDEPAQKAVFEVSLIIAEHHIAVSNTLPTQIAEHSKGLRIVKFAPSPKMSTYLLAFIVGELEFLETKTKEGVQVRTYTVPGKKEQGKFALETAARCLSFYNKYFGIPYPLPTLDLIAIPDFESAAMENWGAITYRESAILLDENKSSTASKQWIAIVIAHEIAHQWFGNLVTMHWWTDLWLNEGFASYMENLATDALFPEWKIWEQFVSGRLVDALYLDSLKNTHPIEIEVHHPEEINEIFDAVSYAKGAGIIRMLAEFLEPEIFRKGLNHYLKTHSFGNTKTDDLWASLEKISKKPVRKIMAAWTRQPGYPIIELYQSKGKTILKQDRFFSSEISRKQNKEKYTWPIPVTFRELEKKNTGSFLLTVKNLTLKTKSKFIKLNLNQAGFYRNLYPDNYLPTITNLIENKKLPTVERVGVVSDYFAASMAGLLPITKFLDLTQSFINETEYVVWEELADSFARLNNLLTQRDVHNQFKIFSRKIFSKIVGTNGWQPKKNETHTTSLLRALVLSMYGRLGDIETIKKAQELFEKIKKGQNIPNDLRSLSFVLTAENGGKKQHQELIKLYEATDLHEEKDRIGRSLGLFKDSNLLKQTLKFAFDTSKVRQQDAPFMLATAWSNPYGRDITWYFVKNNWETILERYGEGGHWLGRFVLAGGGFQTLDKAKDYENFFKTHSAPGATRSIAQALERIRANALWLKTNLPVLKQYFK